MIVFVYDTECLSAEGDDPVSAVLYFHPNWVSNTQKLALCGQLMGTSYFLKDCLFKARVISLQNGKFILKEFGRFVLAVGTDCKISDYLLEHRASVLTSLLRLYHRDFQTLYEQFPLQSQYKNFGEKLYHIFGTYLPILQYRGHIFHNVHNLRVPKTARHIFLEAMQTLQNCQKTIGVLGGAILYHNKIVASQLPETIMKNLILTDPLHIDHTAKHLLNTEFHIPHGVLMITIYLDDLEYRKLQVESNRAQNLHIHQGTIGGESFAFQFSKRKIKRETSLICANGTEEKGITTIQEMCENNGKPEKDTTEDKNYHDKEIPVMVPVRPKSLLLRPIVGTHLPLKEKCSVKNLVESGISPINFDETDSYPEYIGKTSICSTPMAENKVMAVGNVMSICSNIYHSPVVNIATPPSLGLLQSNMFKQEFDKIIYNVITNPNKLERHNSLDELHYTVKKFSRNISLKKFYRSLWIDMNRDHKPGYAKDNDNINIETNYKNAKTYMPEMDNSDEHINSEDCTIADTAYPVLDGLHISCNFFQEFLNKYYKLSETREDREIDGDAVQLFGEFKDFLYELNKLDKSLCNTSNTMKKDCKFNIEMIANLPTKSSSKDRKPLSLPLKSISAVTPAYVKDHLEILPSGCRTRCVPLTPLIAKLSILAQNEERGDLISNLTLRTTLNPDQKSFSSMKQNRKMSNSNVQSLPADDKSMKIFANTISNAQSDSSNMGCNDLQRVELYMCSQQNMTLMLLMEKGSPRQQNLVQNMFEVCVTKFPHMENNLNEALDVSVNAEKVDASLSSAGLLTAPTSSYSFLCVHDYCDVLHMSGHWSSIEINTLERIYCQLQKPKEEVVEIITRSCDTIIYGYKTGHIVYFYKEEAQTLIGIPPPSDSMGALPTKVKIQLQRDHAYMLF